MTQIPTFFKQYYRRIFHEWVLLGYREVDSVMCYENIQEGFQAVLRSLGIRRVRPLPVVNATGRTGNFLDYYTPELRPLAARYLDPFLEQWGYGIPAEWDNVVVPWFARTRFAAVEATVTFGARYWPMDPNARYLQAARTVLRRLRLA